MDDDAGRYLLIGVGNRDRGDDAVGPDGREQGASASPGARGAD